jgi:hypothetical protein
MSPFVRRGDIISEHGFWIKTDNNMAMLNGLYKPIIKLGRTVLDT